MAEKLTAGKHYSHASRNAACSNAFIFNSNKSVCCRHDQATMFLSTHVYKPDQNMIGLVIEVRLEYAAGRGGHGARNVTNIRIRTPASQNGYDALAAIIPSKSNGRTITSEQYCVRSSSSDLCVAYSRFQCWDPALAVINPNPNPGRPPAACASGRLPHAARCPG